MVVAIRGLFESFSTHSRRTVSQDLLLGSSLSVLAFMCSGLPNIWGRCCASSASRVSSRLRFSSFSRLGATIAVTLVLWQISFFGIRVGEASNPGSTTSNSVPASDGVTTPPPQIQDQDLEISAPGLVSRPPDSLPVTAPSLTPASVANPYVSVPPPPQTPCVRSSRFCSFSRPGSGARRPSSQARTVPSSQPFSSSGFRFLCVRSVFVSSSFSVPRQALLSGPLLSRPCPPLSRVGHFRHNALPHRCSPRGAAPWRYSDGLASCAWIQHL